MDKALVEFASQLKVGLKESGTPSNANFDPHLTLGRLKNLKHQTAFYETLDLMRETPAQKVDVKQVILFESVLKQTGAEYHVLGEFHLF
jgi:2'-5' RNA ligase